MNFAYGRISLFGNIGTAQSWSTGWSFAQQGVPTSTDLHDYLANQVNAAVDAAWTGNAGTVGIGDICSPDTTLVGIRAYYYPAGQKTAAAQGEFEYPVPRVGAGPASLPTQTALVASTLSGLPGRSNRGRMYLPCTGATLNGHQLAPADVNQLATNVATMLSSFNAMVNTPGAARAAIASKNGLVPITQIRIDSETDVQRRRADKLRALATGSGVVTGA